MIADWQIEKLGDIAKIMYGHTAKASGDIEGPKYLRITDIQDSKVDWNSVPSCPSLNGDFEKYRLKDGDIVFARTGATTGKSFLIEDAPDAVFASYLIRVQADYQLLTPAFLSYYFQTPSYWEAIEGGISGSAQGGFNAKKLGDLKIPIPPLPEQERIVAKLDATFAAIDSAKSNVERNLQNAKELFDSTLNEVFGKFVDDHGVKTLNDWSELIVDCEHKTAPTQAEGYPSIRTPNIGKGELILDGVYRVSEETYQLWTRRAIPQPYDLIMAREAPAGNVAVVPEGLKPCLGQRTLLIRPVKSEVDSYFLAFLILSPKVQEVLLGHSRGATVAHVNMKDIRNLKIGQLPSIEEQRKAVETGRSAFEMIKGAETNYTQKLTELEDLKKSLLERAFRGEI